MSRSRTGIGAVLLAGVTLLTYACGTDESPDAAAATAAPSVISPTGAATSSAPKPTSASRPTDAPEGDQGGNGDYGPILRGERQVVIPPAQEIRTAKAGAGGEPSCMGIRSNGSNPLTVVAAACDTRRAGQLFRGPHRARGRGGRIRHQ